MPTQPPKLFSKKYTVEPRLIIFGCICAMIYILLCAYSNVSFAISITNYIFLLALAFAVYAYLAYYYIKQKHSPSVYCIVIFAAIFHIIGIFSTPQFEDDFFRYLWDGYTFFEQGNPYLHEPSYYFSDASIPSVYQNLLNQVNHPDIKTIYSPLLQYSFWFSHWLFPADILGLKLIYSACNMAIIFILVKIVNARMLLLYAWNPLIIKEVAFTAHPDILGVLCIVAALYFFAKHPKTSALCLGLSVCSKPFAWLIAIYVLLRFKWLQLVIFFLTIAVLYAPFIFQGSELTGLLAFGSNWEFNAAIYSLFTYVMSGINAKILCVILLFCIMLYCLACFRKSLVLNIRGDFLIGGLLILSPVINPWYLLWLLPFAAMQNYTWPWVFSFTVLFSYFSGINLGSESLAAYQLPVWVKPIEYIPVLLAVCYDASKLIRSKRVL
ncbi:hypothetical protein MNBD_GAMMA16-114 [hydrothermal vent metagenome]|uniref:DUF2029 domain-containing protein n=1 Tax=hydrothermal vent metagenome TaxID=652676 RepID=A0A3B0ZKF3_9ZZZZ